MEFCEHSECLNHLITDAKRHQRSLTITLLGEVDHGLIRAALSFHHIPPLFKELFNNIYEDSKIKIALGNNWSSEIPIKRGVLQGDPMSPILFNLCFNTLMCTLKKPELSNLGYIWGPKNI